MGSLKNYFIALKHNDKMVNSDHVNVNIENRNNRAREE